MRPRSLYNCDAQIPSLRAGLWQKAAGIAAVLRRIMQTVLRIRTEITKTSYGVDLAFTSHRSFVISARIDMFELWPLGGLGLFRCAELIEGCLVVEECGWPLMFSEGAMVSVGN